MRNRFRCILLLGCAILGAGNARAWADGGTLQLVERQGDVQMAVFTAPNPLRAGTVDISVLLQDAVTGQPLPETPASVELVPSDGTGSPIHAPLVRANATNQLMQSALVDLPHAGRWDVTVRGQVDGDEISARFSVAVGAPMALWLSEWPWFSWPALAVALFGVHRYRVFRRAGGSVRH
jgi:hypothetical protein